MQAIEVKGIDPRVQLPRAAAMIMFIRSQIGPGRAVHARGAGIGIISVIYAVKKVPSSINIMILSSSHVNLFSQSIF
jgi:hypothetical protein